MDALITGATGFLGSHLLLNLFKKNIYTKFHLIVRGDTAQIRQEKLMNALHKANVSYRRPINIEDYAHQLNILEGDITQECCGIDPEALPNPVDVWHLAAALDFESSAKDKVIMNNREGTNHILGLIKKLHTAKYYHVSTAYASGVAEGLIEERLHDPEGRFTNDYEYSKCCAEHDVTRFCEQAQIEYLIFRPSIIIGNSETKKPGGAWSTLYMFVKQLHYIKNHLIGNEAVIRINGRGNICPNLIPVDAVIAGMLNNRLNFEHRIIHLASTQTPSLQAMFAETTRQLGINNILVEKFDIEQASPIEQMLGKQIEIYGSYLFHHKDFELKSFDPVHISALDFSAYIAEGLRTIRKENITDIFKTIEINGRAVYTVGEHAHAVYVENAHGMPMELLIPLVKDLSQYFKVLIDSQHLLKRHEQTTIEGQTNRILSILDALAIKKINLVGWCSGCGVLLDIAEKHPQRIDNIVLLNGSYFADDIEKSLFEKNITMIMPKVAKNPGYAQIVQRIIFTPKKQTGESFDTEVSSLASSFITTTDSSLFYLTSKPFESEESMLSYAKFVDSYVRMNLSGINNITSKVLLLTGDKDITVSAFGSEYIAKKIGDNAKLAVLTDADHFMLYSSADCRKETIDFLRH